MMIRAEQMEVKVVLVRFYSHKALILFGHRHKILKDYSVVLQNFQ